MKVKDIYFGSSDGLHESKEENFSEMFYEKGGHFDKLKSTRKFIIIGRKGTGKTTLSSYFCVKTNGLNNNLTKQVFANDFIQKKLLNFAQNEINREENSLFWEYVFLLDLGIVLIDYYENLPLYKIKKYLNRKNVKKLAALINGEKLKIEGVVSNTKIENSLSNVVTLKSKPSSEFGDKTTFSESESITKRRSNYYEVIPELEAIVFKLLKQSRQSVTIFYDDMDQFEESINLEYFLSLMKNMIYSAGILNNKLNECNDSKICLVLREDIIDLLHKEANNLNKQITDSGIKISWFDNKAIEPKDHPLMQMVLHKIKKSDKNLDDKSLQVIYDNMFERKVFTFLMDRSFGRPRDIITYLNFYKEDFPEDEKITVNHLMKVEQKYSKWFFDELLNELALSDKKEFILEICQIIARRGYSTFTYGQMTRFIAENEKYQDIDNLLEVLSIMREYSILGIKIKRKYDFTHRTGFSTSVDKNSKFVVHRALMKCLNL